MYKGLFGKIGCIRGQGYKGLVRVYKRSEQSAAGDFFENLVCFGAEMLFRIRFRNVWSAAGAKKMPAALSIFTF